MASRSKLVILMNVKECQQKFAKTYMLTVLYIYNENEDIRLIVILKMMNVALSHIRSNE